MTVYGDVLFFLNAGLDWLLLQAVSQLTGRRLSRAGCVTASLLGGVLGVVPVLLGLPEALRLLLGAAGAWLLCVGAFGERSLRAGAVLTGVFFALSCLFAGLITAFVQLPGAGQGRLTLMVFVLASCAFYLLSGLLGGAAPTQAQRQTARLTLYTATGCCTLDALRDSGHSLRDGLRGRAAAVVSRDAVAALFPPQVRGILADLSDPAAALSALAALGQAQGFGVLACRTVNGPGLMLSYLPQRVCVDGCEQPLTLALTGEALSCTGNYQAIIGID